MAHYMPKGVARGDVTRAPLEYYASDAPKAPPTDSSASEAAPTADGPPPPGVDVPAPWAREYTRPAPQQVDRRPEALQVSISGDYNIWYNKHATGYEDRMKSRAPALYRCSVERDSGVTKASRSKEVASVCIYFVRGCCHFGHECNYLHRMPTEGDELKLTPTIDIFGRERHANDRDDMGGVGSFSRDNFTLYVSGIGSATDHGSWETVRHAILHDFGEWGPVHHLRIIPSRAIAFLTYKFRATAEIAKESMANQKLLTLPGTVKPLINVRWAYDDPNPAAKERLKQQRQDSLRDAMVRTELKKRGYDPDSVLEAPPAAEKRPIPSVGPGPSAPVAEPPKKKPRVGPSPQELAHRNVQEFSALFGGFYDDPVVQEKLSSAPTPDPANPDVQFFRAVSGVDGVAQAGVSGPGEFPPGFSTPAGTAYDFAAATQRQQVFTNYAQIHAQHAAVAASAALSHTSAAAGAPPPGFPVPAAMTAGPPGFAAPPGMPTAGGGGAAGGGDDRPPGLTSLAASYGADSDDDDLPPGIAAAAATKPAAARNAAS